MLFGAISLIPEPCGSTYEALHAARARPARRHARPEHPPGFIADRDAHLARMQRMIGMADIVKLSDEDLAWFGETGDAAEEIAARWLERGPKLIVITRGSKGAVGYSKEHTVTVAPQKVTVVDTVGGRRHGQCRHPRLAPRAGPAVETGDRKLTEDQIRQVLTFSAKCAAITVSRAGANPPTRAEMG
jgi:fructokinase